MKQDKIKENGIVLETLPSANFRVKLNNGREVLCVISGKLRHFRIKILPGDKVLMEISPYDEKRGRIVYRLK